MQRPGESAARLEIAMAWRGETEDGIGWGGLVPSKSEQRAEARQAALEKDAQRYRWLRSADNDVGFLLKPNAIGWQLLVGGSLDAAIDTAMAHRPAAGAA